jgi:Right handed beta helix region
LKPLFPIGSVIAIGFLLSIQQKQAPTQPSVLGAALPACTLYASPSGSDFNSGNTPASAKTFQGAAAVTRAGSVVCLTGGTYALASAFAPPRNGTPSAWIVYRNYGDAPVKFLWTGPADASPMFKFGTGNFRSGPAYLEFRGLHLDGSGKAGDGFFCRGGHHLRFIDNSIRNTGGSGIGSIQCDYLTADHNIIDHNGYIPTDAGSTAKYYSWTSGISFNSNQWYDSYAGFHNVILNNVVAGQFDQSSHHTDGNGIILDLSDRTYNRESANTPAAIVVNNVVYGNGGRCIEAYIVTNFWFVNNTCYKNNLDPLIGKSAAISVIDSESGYVINNIAVVGSSSDLCYGEEKSTANLRYYRNLCFGSSANPGLHNPTEILYADPLFVRPPYFDVTARAQYAKALSPALLGDGLTLQPGSPALHKGIDPASLPGLREAIVADLKKYVYADINGRPRSHGDSPDLGAYQGTSAR